MDLTKCCQPLHTSPPEEMELLKSGKLFYILDLEMVYNLLSIHLSLSLYETIRLGLVASC